MTHRIRWLITAAFIVASSMLGYSAWQGQRLAIVFLSIFNVILCILLQLTNAIVDSSLRTSSDALEGWQQESSYARKVTSDYVQALGRLFEFDPTAAEVLQDRLSEALTTRYPEITQAVAERSIRARMN